MITGKTRDQKWADARAWKAAYAWLPVRLSDGRWIWREAYFYRDSSADWRGGIGCYSMSFRQRVLEIPIQRELPRFPPAATSATAAKVQP